MTPSQQVDNLIEGLADWRGKTLAKLRKIVLEADPEMVEEWKWMGTPTYYHDGLVLIFNPHKDKVKLTFYNGASLPDPNHVFNAGFGGGKWRAIDFLEGDKVDERALKALVRAAVAHNALKKKKKR
ncbi:MAG TPA: DUF1801 domain-containing protein [Candidatus Dormibacteraeota bacterium]|nr:DUF1801 domain-containing protein [Candidatus Dormibacteraeota bacterium]